MNLYDLINREPAPEPWTEGEKIPWNDPGFSARMLREHLTQDHDMASRRSERIDRHVAWINAESLSGRQSKVLDLGCGPGLYSSRLARLGHECVGIDFSPASIEHATHQAERNGLTCIYRLGDIRTTDYGNGYDFAMLIFGELNAFTPYDAKLILKKAHDALAPDGILLLEPHTFDAVRSMGEGASTWSSYSIGLFSDEPYLYLKENFWHADVNAITQRHYVIGAQTTEVTHHSQSMQAYTNTEYESLLTDCGFEDIKFYPSMGEDTSESNSNLMAIVARKGSA